MNADQCSDFDFTFQCSEFGLYAGVGFETIKSVRRATMVSQIVIGNETQCVEAVIFAGANTSIELREYLRPIYTLKRYFNLSSDD